MHTVKGCENTKINALDEILLAVSVNLQGNIMQPTMLAGVCSIRLYMKSPCRYLQQPSSYALS